MNLYTPVILFLAGLLGVIAHAFKKSSERNKAQEPKYSIVNYVKDEFNSIMFTIICLVVLAYYNNEVKQLKEAGEWLGIGYFGLGYVGDSAFPSLLGLIDKVIAKIKGS